MWIHRHHLLPWKPCFLGVNPFTQTLTIVGPPSSCKILTTPSTCEVPLSMMMTFSVFAITVSSWVAAAKENSLCGIRAKDPLNSDWNRWCPFDTVKGDAIEAAMIVYVAIAAARACCHLQVHVILHIVISIFIFPKRIAFTSFSINNSWKSLSLFFFILDT